MFNRSIGLFLALFLCLSMVSTVSADNYGNTNAYNYNSTPPIIHTPEVHADYVGTLIFIILDDIPSGLHYKREWIDHDSYNENIVQVVEGPKHEVFPQVVCFRIIGAGETQIAIHAPHAGIFDDDEIRYVTVSGYIDSKRIPDQPIQSFYFGVLVF